ncbi:unnamed protein product [Chrysoparadoxa australica]
MYSLTLYIDTARELLEGGKLAEADGLELQKALDAGSPLHETDPGEGAWVMRRCFDAIIARSGKVFAEAEAGTALDAWDTSLGEGASNHGLGESEANISLVLRTSLPGGNRSRYGITHPNSFAASEAVETLTTLGLASTRAAAEQRLQGLLQHGLLVPVSRSGDAKFSDGRRLYAHPSPEEMRATLDSISEGSEARKAALGCVLMMLDEEGKGKLQGDTSFRTLFQKTPSVLSGSTKVPPETRALAAKGRKLALLSQTLEQIVPVADHKYLLKTYPACFTGSGFVDALIKAGKASSRAEGTETGVSLLEAGLLNHVTQEHGFQDGGYFYRFAKPGEIKTSLQVLAPHSSTLKGNDVLRYSSQLSRYKAYTTIDIATIMNAFYDCDGPEGYDVVDLAQWRNHMKRWGFGRPEDRDTAMFDKLSPILLTIDPDEWDVTGDATWESPFGILAQIAVFDQISRAAFRGTPDAFKWDDLAIRATKRAIELGYFESAFKSTLNCFLLLLPLEHSESWEDQKLGVMLLLRMLSTVAIEDEGLSDYEIVKRLEFSKRLTKAFLEHAQVIAKFKRYPHRNGALGRSTKLEERIWLASDLVPIWAKSQSTADSVVSKLVPTIPLKKLTKK